MFFQASSGSALEFGFDAEIVSHLLQRHALRKGKRTVEQLLDGN